MDLDLLRRWLDEYGRAWETRDRDAVGKIFAEDATYQETPFTAPMRRRSAIMDYWSHVPLTQENIHFNAVVANSDDVAIVH
jgi:hypothetical protein